MAGMYPSINQKLRRYSYVTDQSSMAGMYPNIHQDLQVLSIVMQIQSSERILPLVDILVQRSPSEMKTLLDQFPAMNGGTNLGTVFYNLLKTSNERTSVHYALMGLVLEPVEYDSWLIQNLGRNEDILIDIFIGRATEDIRYLLFRLQEQVQRPGKSGKTLSSTLAAATSNDVLLSPLNIATGTTRPDVTYPLDFNDVHRDTEEIIKIMDALVPSHTALFDILLCRSDQHIRHLKIAYLIQKGGDLDKDLRQNSLMPSMMRKIAVHAIRSATDPTYRDALLLRSVMNLPGRSEKCFAIRVSRLHWYKEQWERVKARFMGQMGKELMDKANGQQGLLKHLLVAMCLV